MSKQHWIALLTCLLVWIGSEATLWKVCEWSGYSYDTAATWSRWDSGHYLDIAELGYSYLPCSTVFEEPELQEFMCGNTAWFPGYSWLISGLHSLGLPYTWAANLISRLCFLLSLFVLALSMEIRTFSPRNILIMAVAAFCFGCVYYHAIFPMSMLLCLICLGLFLIHRERLWLASICCLLAALTYSTGFLLAWVMAIYLIVSPGLPIFKRLQRAIIPLAFGGFGVIAIFTFMEIEVGTWTAFFEVQAKYGHGAQTPWKRIGKLLKHWDSEQWAPVNFIILQSLTVIAGYLLLVIYCLRKKRLTDPLTRLAFIYLTVFLIFPWVVGGTVSMYRAESLLMPFVLIVKDLDWRYLGLCFIIEIVMAVVMSYYFLESILV